MLRISKIVDYGTLVLTHMAISPERLFSVADLASAIGLGQPTVSKVLKTLGRRDLVRSSRGSHGGYILARAASQISIAQVVDALEDQPFGMTECSSTPGACSFEANCHGRSNWQRINAIVRRTLEDISIADMVRPIPLEYPMHERPVTKPQAGGKDITLTTWSLHK